MKTKIEKNTKIINDVIQKKEGKKQGRGLFVPVLIIAVGFVYFLIR